MAANRRSTSRGSSDDVGSSMISTRWSLRDGAGDGDGLLGAEAQLLQRPPDVDTSTP